MLPQYNGANSDVVQNATSIGVHKLYDYVLKNKLNVMIDGTFANFEIVYRNIKRSLSRNRSIGIYYIYQDPIVAWEFTRKREKLEGRRVPKKIFIESFFNSKINVKKIKSIFQDKVKVYLVIKNYSNNIEKFYPKIDNIDDYLKIKYSKENLNQLLKKYEE